MNNDSLYGYYLEKLKPIPDFLEDFLNVPSLVRLKKVGYFCGMDYASKDIYSFKEYISRFDHSLSVALLTWKLTHDKIKTLAALFHDIATPCFAHVIDYMNKDYTNQESTEEYTDRIIREDEMISVLLSKHNIPVEDIIDFKKYSIVDNKRPKLCIDRFDGIVLSGIVWCKTIGKKEIDKLVDSLKIYELDEEELGFNNRESAALAMDTNNLINKLCHSAHDNYMMELLADITRRAIKLELVRYDDLFYLTEDDFFDILNRSVDVKLIELLKTFKTIKMFEIKEISLKDVKPRLIDPLVDGIRYSKLYSEVNV